MSKFLLQVFILEYRYKIKEKESMKFILDYNRDYLLEMVRYKKDVEQDFLNSEEQRIINLMQIFIIRGKILSIG